MKKVSINRRFLEEEIVISIDKCRIGRPLRVEDCRDNLRRIAETLEKIYDVEIIDELDSGDPPKIAELLLTTLLKQSHADAMIGCLNERFARDCERFGRRHAVRRYWKDTQRSLLPLLLRAIAKSVKWAIVGTVKRYS
jgi:hypothetical protein